MPFDATDPGQVAQALAHLQEQLAATQHANQELRNQLAETQDHVRGLSPKLQSTASPKLTAPDKYEGKRSEFRQFLNTVKLHFVMAPERFTTEMSRTGFVATLLRGQALDWVTPYLEKNDPIMHSWKSFEEKFTGMFDDPHRARTAATRLSQLRQGRRSVVAYSAEFSRIAVDTKFDNHSLLVWFRQGLDDKILDELIHVDNHSELEAFIAQCILIDTRLRERDCERRNRIVPAPYLPAQQTQGPTPMILDAVNTSQRRGPLTPEERKHRIESDLCLYCGDPGHRHDDCPRRRSSGNGLRRQ